MSSRSVRSLLHATLRANQHYELVSLERLPPAQQAALRSLTNDPSLYGVLRSRGIEQAELKSVCTNTALLFLALREPGQIPAYLRFQNPRCDLAVAELVAEGVLEIAI